MAQRIILAYVPKRYQGVIAPSQVINSFHSHALRVLQQLDSVHFYNVDRTPPQIMAFVSPDLNAQKEIESTFIDDSDRKAIRVVVCDEADNFDPRPFVEAKLCVTIRLRDDRPAVKPTVGEVRGCEIFTTPGQLLNTLADIQLDIAIANSDALKGPLGRAVNSLGLRGLYQLKADYVRGSGKSTYLGPIDKGVDYVPLSSLARSSDVANGHLHDEVAAVWEDFTHSKLRPFLLGAQKISDDIRVIRHVGSQLSPASIKKATEALGPGCYDVGVLRRSLDVRKSPSIKGTLHTIFGAHARVGAIRVAEHGGWSKLLRNPSLVTDGWIAVQRVFIGS